MVDDTMARIISQKKPELGALIAGEFHVAYNDGVVKRLRTMMPTRKILSIIIVDSSDYEESELLPRTISEQYGILADIVIFVNEPKKTVFKS